MQWVILKEHLVNLPPRQLKKVLEILPTLFKAAFIRYLGFMKGRLMSPVLCTVHSLLRVGPWTHFLALWALVFSPIRLKCSIDYIISTVPLSTKDLE